MNSRLNTIRVWHLITSNEFVKKQLFFFLPAGTADLSKVADVASVAGLLKLYLRELPEPLFVFRFYSTFLKIAST